MFKKKIVTNMGYPLVKCVCEVKETWLGPKLILELIFGIDNNEFTVKWEAVVILEFKKKVDN